MFGFSFLYLVFLIFFNIFIIYAKKMNKIHNLKVKQYSIDGNIINIFNNVTEASKIYSNYNSIISCCKGRYKTAGGFIWRFENDDFILSSNNNSNIECVCKICNSKESFRSMAMHLKWTHNIKTKEYISKYGEFRTKIISQNQIKSASKYKCNICSEPMMSNRQLMYHITKKHKDITHNEYIIEHMLNNEVSKCKCGCGKNTTILKAGKNSDLGKETYNRDYIKGHIDWEFNTYNHQSKGELEILNFIKSIYPGEIKCSEKNIIKNKEIDIFIPEKNIAIEYNGLYWHSTKVREDKNYHLYKTIECNKKGIRLIQIFEDEWFNKKDIVKRKITSILGCNNNKIYARKCVIKEITDTKIKNIFLNENHIQGEDKSKIKIGLYYKDELISIMTFSSPRMIMKGIKHTQTYELSRYATKYHIVGGASKLLQYFIKKYNPQNIYSYSDNRWSDMNSNMYSKIGFVKEKVSGPGYYYTKNFTERIHRFNFSKQNLKKMGINIEGKTESKIMEEQGYYKIWDCGVTKYTMVL